MPAAGRDMRHHLREADQLLRARRPREAERLCASLLAQNPDHVEAHLILGRARQMQNDFTGMLARAERALRAAPDSIPGALMQAEALLILGRIEDARAGVAQLKQRCARDATALARIAEIETQAGDHAAAKATLSRADRLQPGSPVILYNLATAEIATGGLETAEAHLDRLIALSPEDYDAWYNRSSLRRQTPERNHVDALIDLLEGAARGTRGETPLCYALAKELEDLGEYDRSFAYLKRGADARRHAMSYRVEDDLDAMRRIRKVFGPDYAAHPAAGCGDSGSIFVLGLPRSGTTLVDRILSSHPEVESIGEVNDLALAVMQAGAGARSKPELIERSAHADPGALGAAYRRSTSQRATGAPMVIDKTPLNFLYIGLIAKALPKAKIVHLEREPMDIGFAMYKTLFRMGYPFSYDLTDIGRYISAKRALMDHWRELFGDRIIDISYESLVSDQEGESRRLIAEIGLDWRPECLAFHENASPSATASAAQVRRPIYTSSVGKWKRYESHLEPLRRALDGAGP